MPRMPYSLRTFLTHAGALLGLYLFVVIFLGGLEKTFAEMEWRVPPVPAYMLSVSREARAHWFASTVILCGFLTLDWVCCSLIGGAVGEKAQRIWRRSVPAVAAALFTLGMIVLLVAFDVVRRYYC